MKHIFYILLLFLVALTACDNTTPQLEEVHIPVIKRTIQPLPEKDFYFFTDTGYLKARDPETDLPENIDLEVVEQVDEEEPTTRNYRPKDFFSLTKDGTKTLYFSVEFSEPTGEINEEDYPEYERRMHYYQQTLGAAVEKVIEISALPEKPEPVRQVMDDGVFKMALAEHEGQPYNDLFYLQGSKPNSPWRVGMIDAYCYSTRYGNEGLYFNVAVGTTRAPSGLYWYTLGGRRASRVKDPGRLW